MMICVRTSRDLLAHVHATLRPPPAVLEVGGGLVGQHAALVGRPAHVAQLAQIERAAAAAGSPTAARGTHAATPRAALTAQCTPATAASHCAAYSALVPETTTNTLSHLIVQPNTRYHQILSTYDLTTSGTSIIIHKR